MNVWEAVGVIFATLLVTRIDFSHLKRIFTFAKTLWRRFNDSLNSLYLPWRKVELGSVFPSTEGFFSHSDLDDSASEVRFYYRFSKEHGGKLLHLVPSGGKGVGEDFELSWKLANIAPTGCGESALAGSKYTKVVDQQLWKGTFKVNTTGSTYDSMGVNIAGCALVAGHAIRNREYVVISGGNSKTAGVKVDASRFVKPSIFFEGSATDFAVARLTGNEWAMVGAKALTAKDFTSVTPGSVDLQFGLGPEGILHTSSGRISQQPKAAEDAGLVLHKVSSEQGASGGVIRRFVGGVPKYTAFHVAKPSEKMNRLEGTYNIAINFDVIFSFMRAHGLYYDSVYSVIKKAAVGESLDYDHENVRDPMDYRKVYKDHYDSDELWERTQELIEQQVFGDEWSRYERTDGKRVRRSGESADVPPPPGLDLPDDEPEQQQLQQQSTTPKSTSCGATALAVGMAVAAACAPLIDLDFAVVKRQVLNSDFSFAGALSDAVRTHGVDKVHNFIVASDAFSVFRDYMDAVQPSWSNYSDSLPDENGLPFFEKVGEFRVDGVKSATTPDRKKKPVKLNEAGEERANAVRTLIKELGCDDDEWVTPENTRANILASMGAHARLANVSAPAASKEDWDEALKAGCADFDTTPILSHAQQGFEGWYKLATTLADSSSGVSARYRNQSKKQWASCPELLPILLDLVQCRLILMLVHSSLVEGYTPEQTVKYGLKDVLLLSVKREPHAPRKVKEKRFRMIWISSLVDCFVQKLLHKALNARDIDNYQSGAKFHSAAGMGHHDEGIAHLCEAFDAVFGDDEQLLTCDASMWDFTMHKEAHLNHAKRRCLSCTEPVVSSLIMTLAHLNYKHLCENKGDVWRCNKEGVNTSGQSSTTADNTFSRHSQAKVCGATKFIGNGDDMVADVGFDPVAAAKFGTKSRDVVIQDSNVVPFTSHHIDRANATASYDRPVKLAWNLLAHCGSSDFGLRVDAMLFVLRNTPDALALFKKHLNSHAKGTGTCNKDLLWAI